MTLAGRMPADRFSFRDANRSNEKSPASRRGSPRRRRRAGPIRHSAIPSIYRNSSLSSRSSGFRLPDPVSFLGCDRLSQEHQRRNACLGTGWL
jgi:hypothetical protein